ncbi:hypothetical protein AAMO2058_000757500 [Amorphochlora amoebiformis]
MAVSNRWWYFHHSNPNLWPIGSDKKMVILALIFVGLTRAVWRHDPSIMGEPAQVVDWKNNSNLTVAGGKAEKTVMITASIGEEISDPMSIPTPDPTGFPTPAPSKFPTSAPTRPSAAFWQNSQGTPVSSSFHTTEPTAFPIPTQTAFPTPEPKG